VIVLSQAEELGQEFFAQYPFRVELSANDDDFVSFVRENATDLVILDRLDNEASLVEALKQTAKVVTFEDLGSGAEKADLLISDLYLNPRVPAEAQLAGVENAILAPSFETLSRGSQSRPTVESILVLFGGTDPANLAHKSLKALEQLNFAGEVVVVRGLGAEPIDYSEFELNIKPLVNVKNMPPVMTSADIALSSAGRTITELASLGVPTICMAQNDKELTHTHTTEANGVVLLGLGADVSVAKLAEAINDLILNAQKRKELSENARAATANRSNSKVVERIVEKLFS
jgi:spore coat polysaccharide biosynthesis predicted glycosyltransferase SpsG